MRVDNATLAKLKFFPALRELSFSSYSVTDAGLAQLAKLDRSRDPALPEQQRQGGWARASPHLPRLHTLELSGDQLTAACFAPLAQMVRLRELSVETSIETDDELLHLQRLAGLRKLSLHHCVSDVGPASPSRHEKPAGTEPELQPHHRCRPGTSGRIDPTLEGLSLQNVNVSGTGLDQLKGLEGLERLELSSACLSDAGSARLPALPHLLSMSFGSNFNCREVSDAGLTSLERLTGLRSLELGCWQFTDAGLAHIRGLTKLRELRFYSLKVTDAGLRHLEGMTDLETLSLGSTPITDSGFAHLRHLTRLRRLHVDGRGTSDAGLAHLRGLTKLQDLSFHATLTDSGLGPLATMVDLQSLATRRRRPERARSCHRGRPGTAARSPTSPDPEPLRISSLRFWTGLAGPARAPADAGPLRSPGSATRGWPSSRAAYVSGRFTSPAGGSPVPVWPICTCRTSCGSWRSVVLAWTIPGWLIFRACRAPHALPVWEEAHQCRLGAAG